MKHTQTGNNAAYTGVLDCLQDGRLPTRQEFVSSLLAMDPLQAVILLAIGLVYMFYGWKAFKVMVVANAAVLGVAAGYTLGGLAESPKLPPISGAAGGLLLAVLAWPLMNVAVGVMGAIIGGFVGLELWRYIAEVVNHPNLDQYAWAGGLIGLITLGMLAFIIFQVTVMVFTSIQGTLLAVSGIIALLLRYEPIRNDIEQRLINDIHLLPLIIAVPAVIAFVVQDTYLSAKGKKKPAG